MDDKEYTFQSVNNLYNSYKQWALSNPQKLTETEAVVKWGSYILAGRLMGVIFYFS